MKNQKTDPNSTNNSRPVSRNSANLSPNMDQNGSSSQNNNNRPQSPESSVRIPSAYNIPSPILEHQNLSNVSMGTDTVFESKNNNTISNNLPDLRHRIVSKNSPAILEQDDKIEDVSWNDRRQHFSHNENNNNNNLPIQQIPNANIPTQPNPQTSQPPNQTTPSNNSNTKKPQSKFSILVCGIFFRILLPLALFGGCIFRYNFLAALYLILLLISPLIPAYRTHSWEDRMAKKHTKIVKGIEDFPNKLRCFLMACIFGGVCEFFLNSQKFIKFLLFLWKKNCFLESVRTRDHTYDLQSLGGHNKKPTNRM